MQKKKKLGTIISFLKIKAIVLLLSKCVYWRNTLFPLNPL